MAVNVRRNGPYAPLGANYADDDAITTLDVAEDDRAELLYLRALAYCARDPRTEGFVSDVALKAGRVLRRAPQRKGGDTIMSAAKRLADLGLWTREDTGYRITAWLKWNKSWAEISNVRESDAARKRGGSHADSDTTPTGVQTESDRSPDGVVTPRHVTAVHDTTGHDSRSSDESSEFEQWWSAYPRKEGKGAARKAWIKARRAVSLPDLIAATERFRDDPNRTPAFTPHPATWLNAERWTDEPLPARATASRAQSLAERQASPAYDPHKEWMYQ